MTTLSSVLRTLPQVSPLFRNFASKSPSWKITEIPTQGFERVVSVEEDRSRLRVIVAIHSTKLGLAFGGLRIRPVEFDVALTDVKRLAIGMTLKNAIAKIGLGGGKAFMLCAPEEVTPEMLKAYAIFLNSLQGTYATAEDVGSTPAMMKIIAETTPFVGGLPDVATSSGDPSPFTAWGVFRGIQATSQFLYGTDSVEGRTAALQGVGSVGKSLAEILFWHGAKLIVTDQDPAKTATIVRKYNATPCSTEEIYSQECDFFAPCALGGTINAKTIPLLRCKAVTGCANNQLLDDVSDSKALKERKIHYAPFHVINAGGIINISKELSPSGYRAIEAREAVDNIYYSVKETFETAKKNGITTYEAATDLAESIIAQGIGKRTEGPCFHHFKKDSYFITDLNSPFLSI